MSFFCIKVTLDYDNLKLAESVINNHTSVAWGSAHQTKG